MKFTYKISSTSLPSRCWQRSLFACKAQNAKNFFSSSSSSLRRLPSLMNYVVLYMCVCTEGLLRNARVEDVENFECNTDEMQRDKQRCACFQLSALITSNSRVAFSLFTQGWLPNGFSKVQTARVSFPRGSGGGESTHSYHIQDEHSSWWHEMYCVARKSAPLMPYQMTMKLSLFFFMSLYLCTFSLAPRTHI